MKYIISAFCILFIGFVGFAQKTISENLISGTWSATEMNKSQIEIFKAKDGFWYGKITASDEASTIGKIILQKAKYNSTSKKWEGELIKPDNGMTLSAVFSLEKNGMLKVVGTKFILSKTFYWTKLK